MLPYYEGNSIGNSKISQESGMLGLLRSLLVSNIHPVKAPRKGLFPHLPDMMFIQVKACSQVRATHSREVYEFWLDREMVWYYLLELFFLFQK